MAGHVVLPRMQMKRGGLGTYHGRSHYAAGPREAVVEGARVYGVTGRLTYPKNNSVIPSEIELENYR